MTEGKCMCKSDYWAFAVCFLPTLINLNEGINFFVCLLKSAFWYNLCRVITAAAASVENSSAVVAHGSTLAMSRCSWAIWANPSLLLLHEECFKMSHHLQIPPWGVFSWPCSASLWPFPLPHIYPWRIMKCRDQVVVQVHWNAQEGFLLIISNPILTAWKKYLISLVIWPYNSLCHLTVYFPEVLEKEKEEEAILESDRTSLKILRFFHNVNLPSQIQRVTVGFWISVNAD